MKVERIMHLLGNNGLEVVAGHNGIYHTISGINVFDNPETLPWLKTGELILTTGYIFKDDTEMQKKLIHHIKNIGCAGLCVKFDRYFKEIPSVLIDLSNELDVPLIKIPINFSLSDITNAFYKEMVNIEKAAIAKSLNALDIIATTSLKGKGLVEISQNIMQLINKPIFIYDSHFQLLSSCDTEIISISLYESTNNALENLENTQFNVNHFSLVNDNLGDINIFRIMPLDEILGYFVVWEINESLTESDLNIINYSINVISIEISKIKHLQEQSESKINMFLNDLVDNTITDENHIKLYGELFNYGFFSDYFCFKIISVYDESDENNTNNQQHSDDEFYTHIIPIVKAIFDTKGLSLDTIKRRHSVVFIVQLKNRKSDKKYLSREIFTSINNAIINYSISFNYIFAVGRIFHGIKNINQSFQDVQATVSYARKDNKTRVVSYFHDFLMIHCLVENISKNNLNQYLNETIIELVNHDQNKNDILIFTLQTYLRNNLNHSLTAKELIIHRNTLQYRLKKIEKLLNIDYSDRLKISVAIELMNHQ